MTDFRKRTIDASAPMRCGQCIFHKHWKVFEKPCKELNVGERDKICTEFVFSTKDLSPLQRQFVVSAIKTLREAGLNAGHIQALMYGCAKSDGFGDMVYVDYGDDKSFQSIWIGEKKGRAIVLATGTGNLSIVDESLLKDDEPKDVNISTAAFVDKQEPTSPIPGKRGRRKGAKPATVNEDIMSSIRKSLSGDDASESEAVSSEDELDSESLED